MALKTNLKKNVRREMKIKYISQSKAKFNPGYTFNFKSRNIYGSSSSV